MTTIFPFVQISKHLKFGTSLTLIVEKKKQIQHAQVEFEWIT